MNESRSFAATMKRVGLPLIIALALVIATVILPGSALIRLEDVHVNRILAGTYDTPDWRVQEMNPLLAQVLTLFYRVIPSVNWYGVLLLLLLALSCATAVSLAARKRGGLLPALLVVSPLLLLFTNSLQSTVVCALCAGTGAMALLDGMQNRKERVWRAVLGAVLFAFAAMLSMRWAVILAVAAVLCWLPCCVRDARVKGLAMGLPLLAIIAAALFGYSALMYASPELSAYRENYALYERVQHSSLKEECDELLSIYGFASTSDIEVDAHTHDEAEEDEGAHDEADADEAAVPPNSFDAVGWTINDASLFFARYGSDTKLTDPDTLRVLDEQAGHISYDAGRLFAALWETLKKPQFLLLIGLFVVSALAVIITSRRKGLIALFAAVIAFGGHVLALMCYYDAFADIAPFYLIGLTVLLYHFEGEDAKAWFHRVVTARWVRVAIGAVVLVCFAGGGAGLLYYMNGHPVTGSVFTIEAANAIEPYIQAHPDMLFIGDNPHDRYKPDTLAAPKAGADHNLLAGSYDLYSPRAAAMMAKYGIENPLPDSVGREDIGYVSMAIEGPASVRLVEGYGLYAKEPVELLSMAMYSERIIQLAANTQEEIDAAVAQAKEEAENAASWAEALKDPEFVKQLEDAIPLAEDEDAAQQGADATATPGATPTPIPSATPTRAPSPSPTASPTASPAASATANG